VLSRLAEGCWWRGGCWRGLGLKMNRRRNGDCSGRRRQAGVDRGASVGPFDLFDVAAACHSWRRHIRHCLEGRWLLLLILLLFLLLLLPRSGRRPVPDVAVHGLEDLAMVRGIGWWCWAGRGRGTSSGTLLTLGTKFLQLFSHHRLVLLLVNRHCAVFFELLLIILAGFQEPFLLVFILLLNSGQLSLKLLLMHGETLNLPFEHLHSCSGNDTANIRHHGLGEDLIDEPVVPHEPGVDQMLHRESIIRVLIIFSWLDIDPSLYRLSSSRSLRRS